MNLSRLFTVQLSMFFVVFSNSDMLSHSVVFVNNFFIFLFSFLKLMRCRFSTASIFYQTVFCLSRTFFIFYFKYFRSLRQLGNFIKLSFVCQQLFSKKIRTTHISNQSGERGIWTLAPVTRPIPLAGAPLRPLEYFSKVHYLMIWYCSMRSWRICNNTKYFSICQSLFSIFLFYR